MFTQPTQIPRSPLASTLTVVFHVSLIGGVVILSIAAPNIPKIAKHESFTFMPAAPVPMADFDLPPLAPPPEALEVPRPEPEATLEAPVFETPPEPASPPPPPPPPVERVLEEPAVVPPPAPRPPPVILGAFGDTADTTRTERTATVAAAGFETAAEEEARKRRELALVNGFDTNLPEGTRPTRTAVVASSGFGASETATPQRQGPRATGASGFSTAPAPAPAAQAPRRTAAAGFGSDPAATTPAPAPPPRTASQPAGFAAAPEQPARAAAPARPRSTDRQVEVLSKPTPAYTDEARDRRIEGDVVLEVDFTAAGQVRVIRVVRGLGYGLDEMARRAAEQIRFRPATSQGVPVDFRATLTIVFRLT